MYKYLLRLFVIGLKNCYIEVKTLLLNTDFIWPDGQCLMWSKNLSFYLSLNKTKKNIIRVIYLYISLVTTPKITTNITHYTYLLLNCHLNTYTKPS